MSNSLEQLITRLEAGPATLGWGAILSFGRDELNRLVKEQYIRGFEGMKFLLPFFEKFAINDDETEQVELTGIVLGPPTLSFESAVLNQAAITVTMNIVNGTFTTFRHGVGAPPTVVSYLSITEDMGFHLTMQAGIHEIQGEVDQHGIVAMDLALADDFICNLGTVPKVQELIGDYFRRYFVGMAEQRRRFVLGRLDLNKYNPLCPTRFAIRVQRAPGADNRLAPNYGDGAVVVFIQVKLQAEEAMPGTPGEDTGFPYLIPDDLQGSVPLYSASLIINHELLLHIEEEQLDILKNLIFPNQNLFVESSRHEPFDMAIFGALKPARDSITISPSSVVLVAQKTQQFVALRGDGSPVAGLQWSVSSPDYMNETGTITANGQYTASAQTLMRRHRLPMVVKATYTENGQQKVASALVQERFHSMEISPLVQIKSGADQRPIVIHASTLGQGPLEFSIVAPTLGARLESVDANHQNYFPPVEVQPEAMTVQKVLVRDVTSGDQVYTSIVLLNKPVYLEVAPHYVSGLTPGDRVPMEVISDKINPEDVQWQVIGEGSITPAGIFTVPESSGAMISVVVGTVEDELLTLYGYSIINLQPVQAQYVPPRWENLQRFTVSAPGGLVQGYANGLQQIPILITLETMEVDFQGQKLSIPVSDVELSKLRFVEKFSDTQVPFIDELQDGIEYGSPMNFAAHTRENRFRLYSAGATGRNVRLPLPIPQNEATRYRQLYLHVADEGSHTFYAQFQADDGQWWSSEDIGGVEGSITVQGIRPPVTQLSDYQLTRDRAFAGVGNAGPDPDRPHPFDYYLDTIDYWRLSYKRLNTYPVVFATLKVENNISAIQWESEFLEETFFSYSGYAFYPASYRGSDAPPDGLAFDIYYRGLLREVAPGAVLDTRLVPAKTPSPGELIISLHRVADMPFWHDGMAAGDKTKLFREKLDPPVIFVLLDEEGNRHRLQIGFEVPSENDSRNALTLNLQ